MLAHELLHAMSVPDGEVLDVVINPPSCNPVENV